MNEMCWTWMKHNWTATSLPFGHNVTTQIPPWMIPHPILSKMPWYPILCIFFSFLNISLQATDFIIWRMYDVIAEVVDHSLDRLNMWNLFAFSHSDQCLLATESPRQLARRGNTRLPRQVPSRLFRIPIFLNDCGECFVTLVGYHWYKWYFSIAFAGTWIDDMSDIPHML